MKLDAETREIFAKKLNLTDEQIAKYESGHLSISHHDELIVNSTILSRKIAKEISDVVPMLDKCNILDANTSLFKIAYKIGDMHTRNKLILEDSIELMSKLDYHNTVGKMMCECKNKIPPR